MLIVVIIWFVLCIILANAGSKRKIGGAGAFFISLLLSPLIGFIVVMASDPIDPNTAPLPFNKKAAEFKRIATKSYKAGDYNAALENLKEAMKISPGHNQDFFDLACIYSHLQDAENAFKYLQKAVEAGYKNFELINNLKALKFVREQAEYEQFALNGYKM